MADKLWVGNDTPGDLSVAANWSPAAVIADDDDVVFNATSNQTDITAGLDSHSGIEVESLHVHPSFTAKMGTSANPLKLATTATGRIIYQGNGGFFYENKQAVAELTARLFIDTDNLDDTIEIGADILRVSIIKGRVTAKSNFVNGLSVNVSYRSNPVADVILTLENAASLGELFLNGGTVSQTGSGEIDSLVMGGGLLVQSTNAGRIASTRMSGGTVIYKASNAGGQIILVAVVGGAFDMSQDGRPNTIGTLIVHPGGVFRPNANLTIGATSFDTTNGSILPITDTTP